MKPTDKTALIAEIMKDPYGECVQYDSIEADKQGREKAIPAGEPADLCLMQLVPVYRWLGRDEFLKRIKEGVKASVLLAEYKARKKGGKK